MVSTERVFVKERPTLEFELLDQDGTAIDLTGLVVDDIDVLLALDSDGVLFYTSDADISIDAIDADPATGKVTWVWPEVIPSSQAGIVKGQVLVRFSATNIRATNYFNLNVDTGLLP